MGVKSTVELTREEAEKRLLDIRMKAGKKLMARHIAFYDDKELEDKLEIENDRRAGGEGFENYSIIIKGEY